MCLGGGGRMTQQPKKEYQNRPVTVSGTQTGVDDPKDTAKATESLMIKRQKEEGTYVDPNLTTAKTLTRSGGGLGAKEKSERSARLRGKSGPTKAQSMAKARMKSKSRMSGSRSGGKR